ncbi:MAG: CaiB/BaiF CoA-transferase family protein [Anaerolineales bacterium]|jgi:formyl-CoA transferase
MELFSSLTVLSLEQATTLPFLTLRLAEEGMRVIRLESPPRGDPNRWVGREVLPDPQGSGYEEGMNAYYLPNNLGKQAITLNLKTTEGQALLHRLIKELPVDIFATNQRPRSYTKLGIDYDTLAALRPDLIWVGITGFGPDHDEAAYDPILQARAGLMELTGEADGDPMVFGLPMVDLGAAEHAYGQVMKALFRRAETGEGKRLDISMFQSAVSWMVSPVMLTHSFGEKVSRRGNIHQFFAPVKVYPTYDGYMYIAVGNDRQWQALTQLPGFTALGRKEYVHNTGRIADVQRLNQEMAAVTATKTTAELTKAFQQVGIPVSKVNRIEDVCLDPLVAEIMVSAQDPRTGVEISIAPPAVISSFLRQQGMKLSFPPRLGEHNDDIFDALGYDGDDLRDRGVI